MPVIITICVVALSGYLGHKCHKSTKKNRDKNFKIESSEDNNFDKP